MRTILLTLIALAVISNCKFYKRETRNYSQIIRSEANTIALSQASRFIPSLKNFFDFAIGTSSGEIYVGSLDDYPLHLINNVNSPIKNMTWNNLGLNIAASYEIKVLDFTR